MAATQRTEIFDVNINDLYNVIADYASYPEFVDGVSGIRIIESSEEESKVEYSLNLIKKFKYILNLKQERPSKVSWSFESGDIFKVNNGSWSLKEIDKNKTEVTYSLEVDIKGFMPKAIVKTLTSKNLPLMMKSYYKRAKNIAG